MDNKSCVSRKKHGRFAKEMKRIVKDHYFWFEKLKKIFFDGCNKNGYNKKWLFTKPLKLVIETCPG